jgi:hypothetical protein
LPVIDVVVMNIKGFHLRTTGYVIV